MGRLKVTPKGKIKKNIPVTRLGKKQYIRRRFAAQRKLQHAGHDNLVTQEYIRKPERERHLRLTAARSYARLGLTADPSAPKAVRKAQVDRVSKKIRDALVVPDNRTEYSTTDTFGGRSGPGGALDSIVEHFQKSPPEVKDNEESKQPKTANQGVPQTAASAIAVVRRFDPVEVRIIGQLVNRYGTDLKRMSFDTKLNLKQWNVKELKRRVTAFQTVEAMISSGEDREKYLVSLKAEIQEKGWKPVV